MTQDSIFTSATSTWSSRTFPPNAAAADRNSGQTQNPGERVDDVLLRVRAEFEEHMANHIPADPFGIYMTPEGCGSGPTHIAQDIVHELAHLTLGQLSGTLSTREHNKVRQVESICGFAIQTQGTSITVTAQ